MKRAFYDARPLVFESVGNGSYKYRWDIQEEQKEREDGSMNTFYTCLEVTVWGTVTRTKVKQTAIDELWGKGVEEKFINDYNAAVLGVLDESYKQAYLAFLEERKALKEQIDADLVPLGVSE